ncbi:MAG: hypothetical protein CHACPFDD_00878 [Phycisphaerae bacterium]|nr:hypothetical protein [Phycisphaerae bacterium]
MGEFAESTRARAAEALRSIAQQECPRELDPVIELIAHLLTSETTEDQPDPMEFVETEHWICWNRLMAERPRSVRAAITATLEWEKPKFPYAKPMLRVWAARLVLSTLDRLAMT